MTDNQPSVLARSMFGEICCGNYWRILVCSQICSQMTNTDKIGLMYHGNMTRQPGQTSRKIQKPGPMASQPSDILMLCYRKGHQQPHFGVLQKPNQ